MDSHLARVTAFLLAEHKYYYWAIGWAFHSLKRYQTLTGDHQQIYSEFYDFLIRNIILRSLKNRREDKSLQSGTGIEKKDLQRIQIRALKDFIDFDYEISERNPDSVYAKTVKENLTKEITDVASGMKEIFSDLIEQTDFNTPNMTIEQKKIAIEKEILEISTYRNSQNDLEGLKTFLEKTFF